jgi:two-component system, NtrC family, sensor kinase
VKREWDSTFDAITDPVSLISSNYRVIRANRSYAARANTNLEDIIGQPCYKLLFNRSAPCEGCHLGEKFTLGDVQTSDASFAYYDVSSHRVSLDKDEKAFVLLYRDNSDVHRINRQILESAKMAELGTIGSSIAHEINNPLGGMIAFLQILKMEIPSTDSRYEDIHEMEQACLRCKTIVENLLAFTRQSTSGEREALRIGDVIDVVTNIMELQTRSMGIRVNKHIQDRNTLVFVGKNEFIQVLVNILQNSCEAIAERIEQGVRFPPGEITIKTFLKGQDLGLEIIDNGTGIHQDQISKVFTPFFTTKNKTKNAGLGLSVSYQIVKELQGSIEISSLGKQNTTVVITVPLARQDFDVKN